MNACIRIILLKIFIPCFFALLSFVNAAAANPNAINNAVSNFSKTTGINNFTILVLKDGNIIYRKDSGSFNADTVIVTASAAKWIVTAIIMTLVDRKKISLDMPVKTWLQDYPSPHGDLTLRQLLSFTAGLPTLTAIDIRQSRWITLEESAHEIAKHALSHSPGTTFAYGGPNFQIAGAVVETVTGTSWRNYAQTALLNPLNMNHTFWGNPNQRRGNPLYATNPILQGGMATSANDYASFLTMLDGNGVFKGKRILSADAIKEMNTLHTQNVKMEFVPPGVPATSHYALGHWCEEVYQGVCSFFSSPGARGTYPWMDMSRGIYGIILVDSRLNKIAAAESNLINQIRQSIK